MPAPGPREREARGRLLHTSPDTARRVGAPTRRYLASRSGTAACLRAIDAASGGGFFPLPPESELDEDAAAAVFSGGPVIDVQTHYVASRRTRSTGMQGVLGFIRDVAPERFAALDPDISLGFAEYLRCVFVESETVCAVLTAAPGDAQHNILPNHEIAATREILDRFAGKGRLLHHAIVHPEIPTEREALPELVDRCQPDGLKVYTLYGSEGGAAGWQLDDERVGLPFLEQVRDSGTRVVCAHKGLSALAPTGSPRDIGPAAAAFPELSFLVYHSGYEVPASEEHEERAFAGDRGSDRLIESLRSAGVAPRANVWAELGSTWACLVRRPLEAAHVVGKLLVALGPDRLLWGTDSIWYGPAQPLIDSFRAFQIPEALRERHGYPELTPALKDRILGENAAQIYDIDLASAARVANQDELGWIRQATAEATRRGLFDPGGA